ncbi:hypothetical protein JHK84_054556 [Glycine max]|nr:hypothetical protein JHK84_054556 [Glycine max]
MLAGQDRYSFCQWYAYGGMRKLAFNIIEKRGSLYFIVQQLVPRDSDPTR